MLTPNFKKGLKNQRITQVILKQRPNQSALIVLDKYSNVLNLLFF